MNSSQVQTAWVLLLFVGIFSCLAFGIAGISSAENLAAAQLAASASDVPAARFEFLGWGALGAVIAVSSMRWARSNSNAARDSAKKPHESDR